jgi:hypothetical protein
VLRAVSDTESRHFPSFASLAAWAVEQGYTSSVAASEQIERAVWPELLYTWYASGQIACLFAVHLARDWETARWLSAVVEGEWDGDIITAIVDAHLEIGAEGLQLLFPGSGSSEEAVEIVNRLAQHPRWRCEETGWLEGETGDSIHVGIRWISPDASYESWAVGIAPFEAMPFTRRFVGAPFIALVIRPTPPVCARAPAPSGSTGLPASHLAHMDDALGANQAKRDKWNVHTRLAKRALIQPDPLSRARAKVTFSFSADTRDSLTL